MAHDDASPVTEGAADADAVPLVDGMPMLGAGTWEIDTPEPCIEAVTTALDAGFRHVDTAAAYGNEAGVGEAIERSAVDREEIFLATKLWIEDLGRERAIDAAYAALDRLKTDYVDLLYVHWPAGDYEPAETMAAMDELVAEGVTERVGVSNFLDDQLDTAVEHSGAGIFANQIECHPLLPREHLVASCREHDVHPVAYSPLGRGRALEEPAIADVAEANGVSPAQVCLAWLRQRDLTAIPKAATPAHIRDNWRSLSLQLSEAEVAKIDAIETRERQVDPSWAPW